MIGEQASLYEQLNEDRQDYLAYVEAQRAALAQARQQAAQETPPDYDRRHGWVLPAATPRR